MATHNVSEYWVGKLTLKSKLDNTDTITLYLSTRPVLLDHSDGNPYYPILQNATFVQKLGGVLPAKSNGRIIIKNARNSMGQNRRFSDYLKRYTPMLQTFELMYAEETEDDVNIASALATKWTDIVDSYRYNAASETVVLQLRNNPIPERTATYEILSTNGWSAAPTSSLGKHLPIVIGDDIEVDAIPMGGDDDHEQYYTYATTFDTDFVNGGIQNYYARDKNNDYVEVKTAPTDKDTVAFSYDHATTFTRVNLGLEYAQVVPGSLSGLNEFLGSSLLPHPIFYGFRIKIQGGSVSGSWDGEIIMRLYQGGDFTNAIGRGSIDKSTISASLGSGSDFYATGSFDEPVVITPGGGRLWYSVINSSKDPAAGGLVNLTLAAGVSLPWTTSGAVRNADTNNIEPPVLNGYYSIDHTGAILADPATIKSNLAQPGFYCLEFTDTPTPTSGTVDPDNGLGPSYFLIERNDSTFSGPDVQNLKFQLKVNGLQDDSSGTLTGVANTQLAGMDTITHLLAGFDWNGSSWADSGRVDTSFQSSTHNQYNISGNDAYKREINGASKGRASIAQLLSDMCRNTASRIVFLPSSGKVGVYAWGIRHTTDHTITESDLKLEEYFAGIQNTVVNDIKINYDRKLINVQYAEQILNNPNTREHAAVFTMNYNSHPGFLKESFDLFGVRDLANNLFNWLTDEDSARSVGHYVALTHEVPAEFARMRVPYENFESLSPLDILVVKSTKLPSEGGTDPNPNPITYIDPRRCYEFSGNQNEYIETPGTIPGLDINPHSFSFYFYLKLDIYMGNPSTSTNYAFFNNTNWADAGMNIRINGSSSNHGTVSFITADGSGLSIAESSQGDYPNDLDWHVVKGSYNGDDEEITMWVDDTKVLDAVSVRKQNTPTQSSRIGDSSQSWHGRMKHAAFWTVTKDVDDFDVYDRQNQVLHYDGTEVS
jgi:hypothetical protein